MDTRVINQKLENLKNCLARIYSKMPNSVEELETNFDLQDIVSINLERTVQCCIDIASHVATDIDEISGLSAASLMIELGKRKVLSKNVSNKLSKAIGFRNLLVHQYANIDWKLVHSNLQTELKVFQDFAKNIIDFCKL